MAAKGWSNGRVDRHRGEERGTTVTNQTRKTRVWLSQVASALLVLLAAVAFTAVAFAGDDVIGDGDIVATNVQVAVNLGTVAPGTTTSATVRFILECKTKQHVDAGDTVSLSYSAAGSTIPAGSVSASDGSIIRPASWPTDGFDCATPAQTASSGSPGTGNDSSVAITAPSSPGTYSYQLKYLIGSSSQPDISGSNVNVTYTLTVAAPAKQDQTITFAQPASPAAYNSSFAVSATASSGLTVSIIASGVCTISSGIVTMTSGTGTCTLTASQAGNGTYNAAPNVVRTVTASKLNQTIDFGALANKTYGDADLSIGATASSGLVVGFAFLGSCEASATGQVHLTGAGTCQITASQPGNDNFNAASSVPQSFTIAKAGATLGLTGLSHTYNGTPKSATVTTTPSDLTVVSVTYDGSATAPMNAGSYAVVASLTNANYQAANATGTLVIAKAAQTITFAAPADKTFGAAPFSLSGSASSDLAVSYAVKAGSGSSCTVSGIQVTLTGAGSCTLVASQAGNANYDAADSVERTFEIAKAAATLTLSNLSATYDGTAKPVTVTTSPADLPGVSVTYDGSATAPTNAGSYAIVASLTNANYQATAATGTLVIAKAATVTTVTCSAGPFTFTGVAQTPCSAVTTRPGAPNAAPAVSYEDNVNAGTATASATYAESANHLGSTDSETFTIAKAATVTTVTCSAGPFTFTGVAQTPCSAVTTRPGAANAAPAVSYEDNVNAGTATASATYAESANHLGSTDSETFTIAKAATVTTVTCSAGPFTFTGVAQAPCSAVTTRPGAANAAPAVSYEDNVNAGTATASATYAESANHLGSTDSETFTIAKAATVTTVTCPTTSVVYDGAAQTPCSVSVTGAGGLNLTPAADYGNNTNAGTATASYTYAGGANHNGSSGSDTFTIAPKSVTASFTTANKVYDGTTAATVQGTVVGKLTGDTVNLTGGVAAFQNKNAGTGKTVDISGFVLSGASAGNYTLVAGPWTAVADITKAPLTVTADNKTMVLNGSVPALTYTFAGFVGGENLGSSGITGAASCSTSSGTAVGSSDIVCVVGTLDAVNYSFPPANFVKGKLTVTYALTGNCFGAPGHAILQPIDADNSSIFKQGSTVPAKFRVCDANGNSISTAGVVQSFRLVSVSNGVSGAVDEPVDSTTPDVAFRWSSSDQQWIFNINTKSLSANKRYTYEITLNDDSKITFAFGLK